MWWSASVVVQRLIIFTRYPFAGRVKTRLIPAIGAESAADLHRQMTEHTVGQARAWLTSAQAAGAAAAITICIDGGESRLVSEWLGADLDYRTQVGSDLGSRMERAIAEALAVGAERVVLIGTDCPGVSADILCAAFERLQSSDLVLGGASDGGYYLIGMRRRYPELFVGIDWSTERVLAQTIAIAPQLQLAIGYVSTLSDVDRPEDLHLLAQLTSGFKISMIIPALNEAKSIATVLARLDSFANVEPIVVDGGSEDDTVAIAQALGVKVVTAPRGRASQMNAGARAATGEILLFLHADTFLPLGGERVVRQTLQPPLDARRAVPVAGAFEIAIAAPLPSLRWIERLVNWRSRWRQMPYGDQAIFVTAETFWELGGFPEQPIMEDFELIRRLRRRGRIAIVAPPVVTSARRWLKLGVWQTTFINQAIVIAYLLGVSPARLAAWYRRR